MMKIEIVCKAECRYQHEQDIEAVILVEDKVISAADDGIVKIWSVNDLKLLHEFQAHDFAVNHMIVLEKNLYTTSIDLSVKCWELDSWKLISTFKGHMEIPRRLATDGVYIYSGDDKGEVIKWNKDGSIFCKYNVIEEIWDLHVKSNLLYCIKDRGLSIFEMKNEDSEKKQEAVACTLEGRSPLCVTDNDIFMLNRLGTIILHINNEPPNFDFIKDFKGHDKTITSMFKWGNNLLSGGWDEKAILWNINEGRKVTSVQLPGCPSAMTASEDGSVFIGGADGFLIKLKIC